MATKLGVGSLHLAASTSGRSRLCVSEVFLPYAPIYSEDTGNHDKEFTEWTT